jgi:hypothetical protein
VLGLDTSCSFTPMARATASAERPDCSDLVSANALAASSRAVDVGTITRSEQSALFRRRNNADSGHIRRCQTRRARQPTRHDCALGGRRYGAPGMGPFIARPCPRRRRDYARIMARCRRAVGILVQPVQLVRQRAMSSSCLRRRPGTGSLWAYREVEAATGGIEPAWCARSAWRGRTNDADGGVDVGGPRWCARSE